MADSTNHELALRVMGVMRRPNQYNPNVTTLVIMTFVGNVTIEGTTIVGMSDVSSSPHKQSNCMTRTHVEHSCCGHLFCTG